MRVIAIANQKGGCGKTTTSINLSACLAQLNKKVLLIDLDPQGHSTCGFGVHAEKLAYSLYDLLKLSFGPPPKISDVLIHLTEQLCLIPSYVILGAAEEELANIEGKEKKLKGVIRQCHEEGFIFDYIVIDCPPNLGVLTYNALEAADDIIIPIEPSFFSLHGLAKISETIGYLNQRKPTPLCVYALLTLFQEEPRISQNIYSEVKKHFQEKMFKTVIHYNVDLKEAVCAGQSINSYNRESQAFHEYLHLAIEYLERDWDRKLPPEQMGWEKTIEHHYGPKRVVGGVLFQTISEGAKSIELVGDFNQWVPEPLISREGGKIWQKIIPIARGKYRYKFIVDGEWQLDPCHPIKKQNAHGLYDSYLELV